MTVPSAERSGLALRSSTSACSGIASSNLSRLSFCLAETSTSSVSPPRLSTWTSCCSNSVRTRSGLASGLSILLIATISGTCAALAWLIASIVCGMTPSSAATTSTTMSVTLAPRARIAVKAAWPGVSMKVILAAVGRGHLIGADVLGDAARFARDDIGLANGVEQRGLAVIDVAHDGDDRRARRQILVGVGRVEQAFLDVGFGDALDGVAHFVGHQCGGVGVDHVGDLVHLALASSAGLMTSTPRSDMRLASS